ncbi:MAG: cytochrome o ubiquinol oxidase subunit IV [Burkholderiales bacterium]
MNSGRELRDYVIGMVMALILTGTAFALIVENDWPIRTRFIAIVICAILQLLVHFRYFLHIDLKKSHRDDLQLILFSGFIIALMVGGMLWVVFNENMRMM